MRLFDSVAAVIRYRDEVFLIERQNHLKAFPGYTAFVGGKVDQNDPTLEAALLRECQEELGLTKEDIEEIKLLSRATSPNFNPVRFKTFFFDVKLKRKPQFNIDHGEIANSFWLTMDELKLKLEETNWMTVPPIRVLLHNLVYKEEIPTDLNLTRDLKIPVCEFIAGLKIYMPLSNTLPPADRTNAFVFGDNPRVLVDPSPKNETEYAYLVEALMGESIDLIVLTHHHPDHHQFANNLARQLGLKIALSKFTFEMIKQKYSENYFDEIEVEFLKEGDVLSTWQGQDVITYELPGHDEGQIGFAPKNLNWFIVGDIFQGIGTVVIEEDVGDMGKYYKTLERLIALSPRAVIPSHGIPLGGVNILEYVLNHRKKREKDIAELHHEGLTMDQIVENLYSNVDKRLWPLAKQNIKAHLKHLELL